MTELRVVFGGVAVVCCPHDREKRQIRTEAAVAELGRTVGQVYDPAQHKLHLCACCENLFVALTDEPRFCAVCERRNVHAFGGGLPEPIGEV